MPTIAQKAAAAAAAAQQQTLTDSLTVLQAARDAGLARNLTKLGALEIEKW
jgi:hypothetical protein